MNPEDFIFYRLDVANEYIRGATASRMPYAKARQLVPPSKINQMMQGKKVRTMYGIYWAEKTA